MSSNFDDYEIVYKDIETLIPYARNPRVNEEAVPKLAGIIREFGFLVPIVIKKDGEILAGHTRLKAAQLLGLKKLPCIVADNLSEIQAKAFRLAENRSAEWARWDNELLSLEIEDLKLEGFNLEKIDFNFDAQLSIQNDELQNKVETDETLENTEKKVEEKEIVSEYGNVWILGNHKLLCGDSSHSSDIDKIFVGQVSQLVITDPPYGVAIGTKNKNKKRLKETYFGEKEGNTIKEDIKNDNIKLTDLEALLEKCFKNLYAIMDEGASFYIFFALSRNTIGEIFHQLLKRVNLSIRQVLIWAKNQANFCPLGVDYKYDYEPIAYGWKGVHSFYGKGEQKNTVWKFNKLEKCNLHPTMKPIPLLKNAILNSSKEDDIVADFFAGSGSTIIACEETNRQCYAIEIDPHYVDVAVVRWQELTGKKAILESTKETYDEVKNRKYERKN